jgi:hypothetical protein
MGSVLFWSACSMQAVLNKPVYDRLLSAPVIVLIIFYKRKSLSLLVECRIQQLFKISMLARCKRNLFA